MHNFGSAPDNQHIRYPRKTTPVSGRILCDARIPCSYSGPTKTRPLRKSGKEDPTLHSQTGQAESGSFGIRRKRQSGPHVTQRSVMTGSIFEPSGAASPGTAPSNLSRWLRGSVTQPLLVTGHSCPGYSTVSSTLQTRWRSVRSVFLRKEVNLFRPQAG